MPPVNIDPMQLYLGLAIAAGFAAGALLAGLLTWLLMRSRFRLFLADLDRYHDL